MQENNMSVFGTVIRNEEIADFMRLLNLAREIFKQELTVVEIMPGVVCKKIHEFSDKVRNTPILAGGLIEFKEDVDNAIEAGATAVSTANRQLWDYR